MLMLVDKFPCLIGRQQLIKNNIINSEVSEMDLGKNLYNLRKNKNLSQEEVAEK